MHFLKNRNFVRKSGFRYPGKSLRHENLSYWSIVLGRHVWRIKKNGWKWQFPGKTGSRTNFVRENFCIRKFPITCRFQICTFWKTGLPDKKPDSGIRDMKIGINHVWMVQNHIAKELLWYLQKPGNPDMYSNFWRKKKNIENSIS